MQTTPHARFVWHDLMTSDIEGARSFYGALFGWKFVDSHNPKDTYLHLESAGVMFGGLVTLRPDHDPLILKVQQATRAGRSAVVVHAFSHAQGAQARELLQQASDEVVSTL